MQHGSTEAQYETQNPQLLSPDERVCIVDHGCGEVCMQIQRRHDRKAWADFLPQPGWKFARKGTVLATTAVDTHGKGAVFAMTAVETQGKGIVSPSSMPSPSSFDSRMSAPCRASRTPALATDGREWRGEKL